MEHRNFLSIRDLTADEISDIFGNAARFRLQAPPIT